MAEGGHTADLGDGLDLLRTIDEPRALRTMDRSQLAEVVRELRLHLISVGAERGGHFAGSLGAVELTVALHATFETPFDRIVWDVGHQAYGHKALTGRRDALRRVKRADGPAGFLRRIESEFDVFGAGHAGTSVSAALGIAEGAARMGIRRRSVAVIGDGAATAGMSFEALNHAGHLSADLRVVFNQNGMSIAPNVGGLHRTGDIAGYARALGFKYWGPVDGHDLEALLDAMAVLRDASGPTLLHVQTRKGKGYSPAETDPFKWHATPPFDLRSGERQGGHAALTWTEAFALALGRIADRDPRVVAITAAMPDGTGLDRFAERHPDRVYDVGIAEQHGVTFAAGLATEGLRPVCAIYSTFLQRSFDQIVHDVALQELPVTFALDRAGLVGSDGPTHHGAFDLAYLRAIPNLVVAAPRDENELQHLLATAIESGRPFAVRFPRGEATGCEMDPDPKPLQIGKGELLREGRDIGLIALGKTVPAALAAADALAAGGIGAAVVDARFVKPLDAELLCAVARSIGTVVTVEDHVLAGGLGSAVLELLAERTPGVRVHRLGLPDCFFDHGEVAAQWSKAGIDAEAIARAAVSALRAVPPSSTPASRQEILSPAISSVAVQKAYAHCAAITRRSHSSFLAAFWMFPREQRRALYAIYAFCRLADDIADDPQVNGDRAMLLERWRRVLADAYRGKAQHPVGVALADAVRRFHLREDCFLDLLRGIERDLSGAPFETFSDLEHYCYCVASTIGRLVCAVRGLHGNNVREYAYHLGIAVQLTNVLRDVGEDAALGRIYLAQEDLRRLGITPENLVASESIETRRTLFALYAKRARSRYELAQQVLPPRLRRALRPAQAMGAIYRNLLETLQARDFPCLGPALRLPKLRRVAVAASVWLGSGGFE